MSSNLCVDYLSSSKLFEQVGVEERPHDLYALWQAHRPHDGLLTPRVEGADETGAGVEGSDRSVQELVDQFLFRQHTANGQRKIDQRLELQTAPVAIEGVHFRFSVPRELSKLPTNRQQCGAPSPVVQPASHPVGRSRSQCVFALR